MLARGFRNSRIFVGTMAFSAVYRALACEGSLEPCNREATPPRVRHNSVDNSETLLQTLRALALARVKLRNRNDPK